jgi:hypothetical protein
VETFLQVVRRTIQLARERKLWFLWAAGAALLLLALLALRLIPRSGVSYVYSGL